MDLNLITLACILLIFFCFTEWRRSTDLALFAALWNNYLNAVKHMIVQFSGMIDSDDCCPTAPVPQPPPDADPLSPEQDDDNGPGPC